jgi:hypothetical protein
VSLRPVFSSLKGRPPFSGTYDEALFFLGPNDKYIKLVSHWTTAGTIRRPQAHFALFLGSLVGQARLTGVTFPCPLIHPLVNNLAYGCFRGIQIFHIFIARNGTVLTYGTCPRSPAIHEVVLI